MEEQDKNKMTILLYCYGKFDFHSNDSMKFNKFSKVKHAPMQSAKIFIDILWLKLLTIQIKSQTKISRYSMYFIRFMQLENFGFGIYGWK